MQEAIEAREEVLWILAFAVVTGMLLFSLFAGTSWAATMLGAWSGSFGGRRRGPATGAPPGS